MIEERGKYIKKALPALRRSYFEWLNGFMVKWLA